MNSERVDVVPSKIKSPIDFVVLGLIIGAAIGVQFLFMSLPEDELGNTVFIGSLISSGSVATAAFIVAKRYWGTKVFGKSYHAFCFTENFGLKNLMFKMRCINENGYNAKKKISATEGYGSIPR